MNDKPTLTGKLLVAIVGQCGAGNGRCVVSPQLPKPGTLLEERWEIDSYVIECKDYVLRVKIDVIDRRSKKPTLQSIMGPELSVTDRAYQEASSLNLREETRSLLTKLWGKSHSEASIARFNKDIQEVAMDGRRHGIICLVAGGMNIINASGF